MSYKGFTNISCEFYPCHKIKKEDFNCLFCYCPLYTHNCNGNFTIINEIKDCSNCILPHNGIENSWNFIVSKLKK